MRTPAVIVIAGGLLAAACNATTPSPDPSGADEPPVTTSSDPGACGASCTGCCFADQCVTPFPDCAGRDCVACSLCNPDNCDGCCAGGRCMKGDDVAACGEGGAACVACRDGRPCQSGRCAGIQGDECGGEKPFCAPQFSCLGHSGHPAMRCLHECNFRKPDGSTSTCPEGLRCDGQRRACFRPVSSESQWSVSLTSARLANDSPLLAMGQPDPKLVLCVGDAARRRCSKSRAEARWASAVSAPGPFSGEDLRALRIELYAYLGSDSFEGCAGSDCAQLDPGLWQRVRLSAAADDVFELVPRTDQMLTTFIIGGPEAATWGDLYLQETPTGP